MNHIKLLHNGDPKNGSPHWSLKVWEDGIVRGEILNRERGRFLPTDQTYPGAGELFLIPGQFASRQLESAPHFEEVIVSCETPEGRSLCSFLLTDVSREDPFHVAVEHAIRGNIENTEPEAGGYRR